MSILCINAFILRTHHLSLTCISPVSHLCTVMSILCINAFIYAAKYREFQQGVRRLNNELAKKLNQQQIQDAMPVEMADI